MDVSILLFYNKDRGYLNEAIKSAAAQEFGGTFEIITQCAFQSTSKNINQGVNKCSGKYIKLLADDDIMEPNCIQDLFNKAEQGFDIVCAGAKHIDATGNVIDIFMSYIPRDVRTLALDNTLHGATMLYRRELLYLNETLNFGEEFDYHLRMADLGYKFGLCKSFVYKYRLHDNQKSMQGGFTDGQIYIKRKREIRSTIVERYENNTKQIQQ